LNGIVILWEEEKLAEKEDTGKRISRLVQVQNEVQR
jgi:hypothetical protein